MDDLENVDTPEVAALRLAIRACLLAGKSYHSLTEILETERVQQHVQNRAAERQRERETMNDGQPATGKVAPFGSRLLAEMDRMEGRMLAEFERWNITPDAPIPRRR